MKQNDLEGSIAPKISKEDWAIDWEMDCRRIHNQVRSLSPKPGAYTYFNTKRIKISETKYSYGTNLITGKIEVSEDRIYVGTGNGVLEILLLQIEGKPVICAEDFINGYLNKDEEFNFSASIR